MSGERPNRRIEPPLLALIEDLEGPGIRCPNCRKLWTLELLGAYMLCGCDETCPSDLRTMAPTDFQRGYYAALIEAQDAFKWRY